MLRNSQYNFHYYFDFAASGVSLKPLIVACAMIGKFMISYSFSVLFVYTPELMPTVVR